jgi:hypothetical protein
MTDTEHDAPTTDRTFWSWLREHKRGSLHSELSEELATLIAAVQEHEKAGSLTLKISVAPASDGRMVVVTDDVTSKIPQADRGASLFFTDEAGGLHREDPMQMKLDTELRVVETSSGDPVVIEATTGEVVELH